MLVHEGQGDHGMRLMAHLGGFALVGITITACKIGETSYETITLPMRQVKEKRTCDSAFVVADLSKAKPCGTDGKSHCWALSKVNIPPEELEPCDAPGEACMPDKLLLSGGKKAGSCTFAGSEPGGCVPLAFKQVAKNAAFLQRDACDADEVCAPCIDPRDNTDSGVCSPQGVHEKDCVGGVAEQGDVESCCAGLGTCLKESSVPESARGDMSPMGCSKGTLCAPAALADENPKKCETVGGFDGVCIAKCFNPMMQGLDGLSSDCNAFEICLPCFIGEGQGMPGCGD